MPAVRMTKVMPIAISPVIEIWRMTLNRLSGCRKRGSSSAKTSISTRRKITGAKRPRSCSAIEALRRGAGRERPVHAARPSVIICISRSSLASPRSDLAGDPALAHRDDAVGDRQDLRQLRADRDDRDAAARHAVEQLVDLGLGGDVDAAGRLVDDQDLGLERQPARQHHLLLVAAGEVADQLVGARHADVEASPGSARPGRSARSSTNRAEAERGCRARRATGWCAPRAPGTSACCLRSSGTRPMPALIASSGERDDDLAARRPGSRRCRCVGAEDRRGRARCGPSPSARRCRGSRRGARAGSTSVEHAGMGIERVAAPRRCPRPRAPPRPASRAGSGVNSSAAERPTIIRIRSSTVTSATAQRADQAAVAQHRRPVADLHHLVQAMGDEDDAEPLRRAARGRSRTGARPRPRTAPRSARP